MRRGRMGAVVGLVLAGACASPRSAPVPGGGARLPPIPPREGPIAIDVVYPAEGAALGTRDSTFVFGNVGTGEATLEINGAPVRVEPNGAFLAYLPVPADSVYDVVASAGGQVERLERRVTLPGGGGAAGAAAGPELVTWPAVAPGDSSRVPGVWEARVATSRSDGTAVATAVPGSGTPYHWFFPNGTLLRISGALGNQLRVRLTDDLSVWVDSADVQPVVAWPAAPAANGSAGAAARPAGAARAAAPARPAPDPAVKPVPGLTSGYVANVVARPSAEYIDIRLGTSDRLPFRVDGEERGLTVIVYGAETRTNNLLYGATDPLIERMEWEAPGDELYRLKVELTEPLWGFQSFFDEGGGLVIRVRRPPAIDAGDPVRGLYIAVDAGHPPGGAIGPTRLMEPEATLGVARRLAALLEGRGARVLETRPDTAAVGLGDRPLRATEENADLLVSVHFDAFPDGVNPFENHGTHVFYNQAQSLDLARAVQRELLAELGLRDLGVSRRDLALVRPTWMPSILSESAFMMIPQNEAALRDPAVLDRIAAAHLRGIEAFLRSRANAD